MIELTENIKKLYFRYLIPSVGGSIAVAAYSFVDTIAIGQGVGANGTAACAVVTPVFCVAHFMALILGVGGSVLMSRARGEQAEGKSNAYFTATAILTAVLTAIVWLLMNVFQEPFYRLFGADDVLMPYIIEYGQWIVWFFPVFVLIAVLGCFVRCDGAPNLVMAATLTGGCINIFGDWFLVFPMNMGMAGAAIATVAGAVVQVVILLGYFYTASCKMKFDVPFNLAKAFRKILTNGFGAGVSHFSVIVVSLIANNQIMKYSGADALAVYGMLGTVAALFMGIYSGVGQAVQPIAAPNYGAGKKDRCLKVCKYGTITVVLMGIAFTLCCLLLPMQITALFMKTTQGVEAVAGYIVRVYGISFLPLAFNVYAILYLQCVGKEKMASVISLLRGLVVNCLLLFVLPLVMQSNGIWWAITAAEIAVCLLSVWYMTNTNRRYRYESA